MSLMIFMAAALACLSLVALLGRDASGRILKRVPVPSQPVVRRRRR
jgi:hypothetical protein